VMALVAGSQHSREHARLDDGRPDAQRRKISGRQQKKAAVMAGTQRTVAAVVQGSAAGWGRIGSRKVSVLRCWYVGTKLLSAAPSGSFLSHRIVRKWMLCLINSIQALFSVWVI
jgi:hypothetical protein